MYLFQTLGNHNVPYGADIIGSTSEMSGEIIYTYYWYHGDVYCVGAWVGDKPQKLNDIELNKLLGWVIDEIKKGGK